MTIRACLMVSGAAALSGILPAVADAQMREPPMMAPTVVTTGTAIVRAAPDRAFVEIVARALASAPVDAQQQSAKAMASVQKRLQAGGTPAEAIRTLRYDLGPEYDFVNGKQVLRGYAASHTIEVRIDAIDKVAEVIDQAVQSGATSIGSVRFDLKNREQLERDALKRAVADARARAEAAAAGAGQAIDAVLRIEEEGVRPEPRPMVMREAMVAAAPPAPTPIAPGELEIVARVTLTARLK